MEMINKAAYQDLTEVGMPEAQAQAVAAHIPDWSQFATKDDLAKGMSQLDTRMIQLNTRMSQSESRLIRWMVGIFLTFLGLLGGLVMIALNVTVIMNTLQNLP